MSGTIFKRKLPSGRITWGYSIDIGRDEAGRRLRKFESGFERKSEAEAALRKTLNEKDAGGIVKPDPATFSGFMEEWFREHAQRQCSPKTVERYRDLAGYILPHIGKVPTQELSGLTLERLFNHLKDAGGHDRKTGQPRPLSAKTVHHIAGLVHVTFSTAVRWKLVKTNPMAAVVLPKVAKEARALDPDQTAWYMDAARAHGLYEIVMLASATGCRRGELLALAWPDLNLFALTMRVSKSLEQTKQGLRVKGTKSEQPREISLPVSAVDMLQVHREQRD